MRLLILMPSSDFGGVEKTTWNLIKNTRVEEVSLLTNNTVRDFYADVRCKLYLYEDLGISEHTLALRSIYSNARVIKKIAKANDIQAVLAIKQFSPVYACFAKDFLSLKAKVTISYRANVSAFLNRNQVFGYKHKLLVYYTLKSASGAVVSSHGVKEDLVKNFGARESKIKVIPNSINSEGIRLLSGDNIDIRKDCPWVVTSARLDPVQKDFLALLKAFRIVRQSLKAKLLIIGEGPLREKIISWIKEMSLDEDILLIGFQKNPFKYISKAEVFVLSSFVEGFGNVIIEAMALGIPVISTDCPSGPGEIIDHGVNGFLVPVGDYRSIAEYILEILHNGFLRLG